jgi:proteasome beta subunit
MVEDLKTGTTTVGLIYKDGIVLAADMRASMGHLAYDEESKKLYKITDKIAVTNAGAVGDSLAVLRFLISQAQLYEVERQTSITPKALTTLVSNILNATRAYPYMVQFIIAGLNTVPEIYEVTPFGGVLKRERYAVSGSGTEPAMTTLDQNYRKGMNEDEAIRLAVKAVNAGKKRDVFSGGKSVSVMLVNKNGVQDLGESEVAKYAEKDMN